MQPIFIGDVQGCADELDEMLDRAEARFGSEWEAWLVGDLVNRGPGNLRVLARVRELVEAGRARVVLGNHEIGLLLTAWGLRELSEWDSFGDVLEASDTADWIAWLRGLPLMETGELGGQRFAMIHAAAHPAWSLEALTSAARGAEARLGAADEAGARRFLALEPEALAERDTLARFTRCRSAAPDGRWSSEEPAGDLVAWHLPWSAAGHDYGIVYGHWALQGLHVAPGLRGLDTGCVHHGRGHDGVLTAWVPDPDAPTPFAIPDERFWQVAARRAYYAHRDRSAVDGERAS